MKAKKHVITILVALFWIVVWEFVSRVIDNIILFAGPYDTLVALINLTKTRNFYLTLAFSFGRIAAGFIIGFTLGIIIAFLSYRFRLIKALLSPLISLTKSVPVASFAIIVLVIAGASNLALIISLLISFPTIYLTTLEGLKATDKRLLEMARVYKMRFKFIIQHIYLHGIYPSLRSSIILTSGMCFKGGIAAEVIGRPLLSIGRNLYDSKIYLDTPSLLAWTFVVVILSFGFEKLITYVLGKIKL